jgi:hypothetical protein
MAQAGQLGRAAPGLGAVDSNGGVVAVAAGEGKQLADLPFVEFVPMGSSSTTVIAPGDTPA